MSIKAAIYHLTHYKYDRPVILAPQIIRLRRHRIPRPGAEPLAQVAPAGHFVNLQQDPYGNWLAGTLPQAGDGTGRSRSTSSPT